MASRGGGASRGRKRLAATILLCVAVLFSIVTPSVLRAMRCSGLVRGAWRFQMAACALVPLAAAEAAFDGTAWVISARARFGVAKPLLASAVTGILFVMSFGCFSLSLSLTSMAHSGLFANCSPVFITLASVLSCVRVPASELIGVVLAIAGMALVVRDTTASDAGEATGGNHGHTRSPSLLGDALGLMATILFCLFMVVSRWMRSSVGVPTVTFLASWTLVGVLPAASLPWLVHGLLGIPDVAGADAAGAGAPTNTPTNGSSASGEEGAVDVCGVFSWWSGPYLAHTVYLGLGMGIVCQGSIAFALRHLPPLVCGLVLTLNPIGIPIVGYVLGEGAAPGAWTAVGAVVCVFGISVVLVGGEQRQRRSKVEEAQNHAEGRGTTATPAADQAPAPANPTKMAHADPDAGTELIATKATPQPTAATPTVIGTRSWSPRWLALPLGKSNAHRRLQED